MGANSSLFDLWPIALMFALIYFLMVRPQQKRAKQQREMLASLSEGSEVITSCGMLGRIAGIEENIIHLEIAPGTIVMMQKAAIVTLLPAGTMDTPAQLPPPPPSCCA